MTVLSDWSIERLVAEASLIDPYDPDRLRPASYDVVLGHQLTDPNTGELVADIAIRRSRCLDPGEFILGHTVEVVRLPPNVLGRIEGRSSVGRRGLSIHVTAGFIDPGFEGQLTLELLNVSKRPILLREGMGIGQLSFQWLDRPARRPYGSDGVGHYQHQRGAVPARGEL